jgi:hypothetical protein
VDSGNYLESGKVLRMEVFNNFVVDEKSEIVQTVNPKQLYH